VYCKPFPFRGYVGLLHASIFCASRSAALLGSNTSGRSKGDQDSEAIRYVGRYVEVYGLVVSVTASPFGTTFINFGREYPNQTFGGFIPADSGITADQITKLEGKIIGIVGTIELHKGKPEIKTMSLYQIVALSSKLAE
jgi:hypothetical protein